MSATSYINRALSCVLTGAAAAIASALLSVVAAMESRASKMKTLAPEKAKTTTSETEAQDEAATESETESETETEYGPVSETVGESPASLPVTDEDNDGQDNTLTLKESALEMDAAAEADVLRSLLVDAEDRADAFAHLLARAEARIATLQTENDEATSALYDANDVAYARALAITRLEVELAQARQHNFLLEHKLEATDTIAADGMKQVDELERIVSELEEDNEEMYRNVDVCRELVRRAFVAQTKAEAKLGGRMAALESVRRDHAERREDVWQLEQRVRELERQLEMYAHQEEEVESVMMASPIVTSPMTATEPKIVRRSAAVAPLLLFLPLLQKTEASAHRSAPHTARPMAYARSNESEAAGRCGSSQRKRESAEPATPTSSSARTQMKTKTKAKARTPIRAAAAVSRVAAKPRWC